MRLQAAAFGRVVGLAAAVVVILAAIGLLSTRRGEGRSQGDLGIPGCPASALTELLSPGALQCWLDAPNGRWRILGHESVHGAVVVHVEAAQVRDAEAIAQRFVDDAGSRSSEILVYVTTQSPEQRHVTRRIRWAPQRGFDALEFVAPPP
jgi:hypothetical protein